MPGDAEKSYHFAEFTLDLLRGRLSRAGDPVELRPKSFAMLRYLLENAGRLVSKEELAKAIWPHVIVTDDSLSRCLSDVRCSLGDAGQNIIRTVPRRGYRFDARVSTAPPEGAGVAGDAEARSDASHPAGPATSPENRELLPQEQRNARLGARCAERRYLTVMNCELVGLTTADSEDAPEVVLDFHRLCNSVVERHHGLLASYLDDGMIAYFGYPQADEHAAEYAVRAGLMLVDRAARGNDGDPRRLRLRIGLASGMAVIGDHVALGETPALARRLRDVAAPGSVLIARNTRRLVGGLFEYRALDATAAGDPAPPARGYQVLGASDVKSRFHARCEAGPTALIGREEELELLQRRWRQASEGEGRIVLLCGELGIGKSRLVAGLEDRLQTHLPARLSCFCSPDSGGGILLPALGEVEQSAEFRCGDPAAEGITSCRAASAPRPDHPGEPDCRSEKSAQKQHALATLRDQFESLTRHRPVLAVFEDVHSIDPATRELLDFVIARAARLPVLLVLTFRPEFRAPWIGESHVTPMILNRLGRRESFTLVRRVAGDKAIGLDVLAEIVDRGDGIPLFLEELTRAVLEAGAGDGARQAPRASLSTLGIPATLHAPLMVHLDRLDAYAKAVAQIGAVIGREFAFDLLARVTGADDERLRAALSELCDARLLSYHGSVPQATFTFRHALLRDAAYDQLLGDRRREAHRRVAASLREHFPDVVAQQPDLLARHDLAAGRAKKLRRPRSGQRTEPPKGEARGSAEDLAWRHPI